MKRILSAFLIISLMICNCLAGCTPFRLEPNEADSVENIGAVSISDCDYDFYQKNFGSGYRINDERVLLIGDKEDGMVYDGQSAYVWINGEKYATRTLPFEKFDTFAQETLEICQQIIQKGFYTGCNDDNPSYRFLSYHFEITDEGLALFTAQKYARGRIDCIYRDGVFEYFELGLCVTEETSEDFSFTFGTITHSITYSSALLQ